MTSSSPSATSVARFALQGMTIASVPAGSQSSALSFDAREVIRAEPGSVWLG